MLMQIPGPKDIVIYWPGPWAFSVVQKPWGWAHILVQKPQGAPGGMVTSQIDTCITVPNGKSKLGADFFYSDLKFTAIHSLK